jgi:peptidyl-prolyl cis-trans isomerase A (cyclophilin A)
MEATMKRLSGLVLTMTLAAGCEQSTSYTPVKPTPKPSATPVAPKESPKMTSPSPTPSPSPVKEPNPALLDPSKLTETAPAEFKVKFETSKGTFVVKVTREWAPNGADRFYNLVKNGYFDDVRFFRVMAGFMAQFGIHGDPRVSAKWRGATMKDDPVKKGNARGRITFAMAGPNTRTTQLFINFGDNSRLDSQGFPSFGEVVEGMEVVDAINSKNGERPDQQSVQTEGNAYLNRAFPDLDYVKTARIVQDAAPAPTK